MAETKRLSFALQQLSSSSPPPPPAPPPPPPQVQTAELELVLAMEMGEVAGREEEFGLGVSADVAGAVGGRADKVRVVGLRAGSVVASVAVEEGVCGEGRALLDIAHDLHRQATDPTSPLRQAPRTKALTALTITRIGPGSADAVAARRQREAEGEREEAERGRLEAERDKLLRHNALLFADSQTLLARTNALLQVSPLPPRSLGARAARGEGVKGGGGGGRRSRGLCRRCAGCSSGWRGQGRREKGRGRSWRQRRARRTRAASSSSSTSSTRRPAPVPPPRL